MKLATELEWYNPHFSIPFERIKHIDRLGYDVVFSAEANGSDALTPLGLLLGVTERVGVGTCVAQIWGRTPTVTAMAFQTLSAMAGPDRPIVAGLGAANAASVEAWHGQRWARPMTRMREYVEIMRRVFKGDEPVAYQGTELSLPYDGEGALGVPAQKPLLATNPAIPICVGAGSETTIAIAAEIADGWMPLGFAPGMMKIYEPMLEAGFKRAKTPKSLANFDIWAHLDAIVSDDVKAAMRPFKVYTARYAGGWPATSKSPNIYKQQMIWCGYAREQERVEELYQAGRHAEAADAVPDEYIDDRFLMGPLKRIAERAKLWRDAGPTGLIIRPEQRPGAPEQLEIYETIAKAVRG